VETWREPAKVPSRVGWAALRIAALLVVLSAIMLLFERKLIYFPSASTTSCRAPWGSPSRTSPSPPRTGPDPRLVSAATGEPRWTVLLAHGNAAT